MLKNEEGVYLIYWLTQPGKGREHFCPLWLIRNQSDPKIVHRAIECVTLCWSASEGLSPQLGKEASLLPSNTIHTLLTFPPVLSFPVHSHPDTPSPPTTSLHGWLCLVLWSMHVCCLHPANATGWASPFFASSADEAETATIRKQLHLQRKS